MKIATDIGGTFTDIVFFNEDMKIRCMKVPSTPKNPETAIIDIIKSFHPVAGFYHGTTVATNALLERKGARVAFLVTEGFRDLLHIGRQTRPHLYSFDCSRPEPVSESSLCFEVPERLSYDGSVIRPLSSEKAEALARKVKDSGAEVAAICLLFSYKNPGHEIMLEKTLNARGIPVSRSSYIIPEFREFERASTTAINAFVQPVLQRYLEKIGVALKDSGGPSTYYVMKSNGGIATADQALPVEVLLSGPAGGVSAGVLMSHVINSPNMVTFDMGGTSADFSAICNHMPIWTDEGEIDGLPIRIPIIDITTVGAGGGSIAWIDKGGALRVGPRSAGADPGPACYGKGGTHATVTDANLLAGLINPDALKKNNIRLDEELSEKALLRLSEAGNLDLKEAILGVRAVVNANMLRGIRKVTMERGIDVRSFTLLAFGGAGPLHAADLARELGINEVVVPPFAGVFSALGILLSDIRFDFTKSLLSPWNNNVKYEIEDILRCFRAKARKALTNQGISTKKHLFTPFIDMRYCGQSFHIPIHYDKDAPMKERFRKDFYSRYGYILPEESGIEVVNVRLCVVAAQENVQFPRFCVSGTPKAFERRMVLKPSGWMEVPVFSRACLPRAFSFEGPAIIEDEGSTIYTPEDFYMIIDKKGCLRMRVNQ